MTTFESIADTYSQGIEGLTTKSGLVQLATELKHLSLEAREVLPVSYLLSDAADLRTFVDEFRLQAAVNMIQVLLTSHKLIAKIHQFSYASPMSTLLIEPGVLQLAMRACRFYIIQQTSVDESNFEWSPTNNSLERYLQLAYLGLTGDQWKELLSVSQRCNDHNFHHQEPFPQRKINSKDTLRVLQLHFILQGILRVNRCLLSRHHRHNIWIIKAAEGSKGKGINISDSLESILAMESDLSTRVAQRYIETPLLLRLHGEEFKFDLRIWVLVLSYHPLEAYVYNNIYGRRCSDPYSLDRTQFQNSFVHLTNYSLQKLSTLQTISNSLKMKFKSLMTSSKVNNADELLLDHEEITGLVDGNDKSGFRQWDAYTWPTIFSHIRNLLKMSAQSVVHRSKSFELLGKLHFIL